MNQMMHLGNPEKTMSSREIAEVVESRHDSVKRTMETLAEKKLIAFTQTVEKATGGRPGSVYHVNKRDSYVVVAQLSPEFTARLVDRWQELENQQPAIPQTLPEALRLAADLAEKVEQQQALIKQQKPAVEFVGRYVEAAGTMTFTEVCKVLGLKRHELRQIEQDNRVMYQLNGHWTPYQNQIDAGRFTVKTGSADNGHAFTQARYTPKGVEYLAKLAGLEVAA